MSGLTFTVRTSPYFGSIVTVRARSSIAFTVAGGVCERFPDLKLAFLEANGGWIVSWLERLDHQYEIFPWDTPHLRLKPSEYFRRQCWISFDPDESLLAFAANSPLCGADRIVWASDYPHADAVFPGVTKELSEAIAPLDPEQQAASQYMLLFRSAKAEQFLSENNYAGLMAMVTQFGSKWDMPEEIRLKYIEAWSRPGALTGGLNYYRMSPLYPPTSKNDEEKIKGILNLHHEMLEVKVPTLVIWGELDQALLTGNLEGLGEYVSGLAIRRIPGGSHWVTHEQPGLVNSLIRDFIFL